MRGQNRLEGWGGRYVGERGEDKLEVTISFLIKKRALLTECMRATGRSVEAQRSSRVVVPRPDRDEEAADGRRACGSASGVEIGWQRWAGVGNKQK
jgi:hypothetical protein